MRQGFELNRRHRQLHQQIRQQMPQGKAKEFVQGLPASGPENNMIK
jgi:hypothetical protein